MDDHTREAREAFETLLSALAKCVESPYYTQHTSPLGKGTHLAAIREERIKGWKVGRLVYARKDDVHAYIEAHPVRRRDAGERVLGKDMSVSDFLRERGIR